MPARFATLGDPHAGMDDAAGSLEGLLELAARDEASGLGDAPWPPHFRKTEGEAPRVAPSRAKGARAKGARAKATKAPREKMPLVVVANSPNKEAALAGLERWKAEAPGRGGAPRGRRRARRLDARSVVDLDARPREPAARPGGEPPAAGDAGSGRRSDARVAERGARGEERRVSPRGKEPAVTRSPRGKHDAKRRARLPLRTRLLHAVRRVRRADDLGIVGVVRGVRHELVEARIGRHAMRTRSLQLRGGLRAEAVEGDFAHPTLDCHFLAPSDLDAADDRGTAFP